MNRGKNFNIIFYCLFLNCCFLTSASAATEDLIDYTSQIHPIFEKYCVACHVADDPNGQLIMESFEALNRGGEHGVVITPGVPESSRLFLMASGKMDPVMPPDDMEGLNEDQLTLLRTWIEQGAKGPSGNEPMRRTINTPRIPTTASATDLPVTAMALSNDEAELAIARFGNVEILDAQSKAVVDKLEELPGKINDMRFSNDGKQLIIASGITGLYGHVAVYDLDRKEVSLKIDGHRDTLYAAQLSPDGSLIASGGYDRDVHLWNAQTGALVRSLKGHNGAIFDLSFSSDGKVLATASADETVKLWRVSDGERLDTLSQPQGEVWGVGFSPDNKFVVAASGDNRFRVWQFESRDEPRLNSLVETRFADDTALVRLEFTPDSKYLLIASQSGRIGVFETENWTKLADLNERGETVSELSFSQADSAVYVATMSGAIEKIPFKIDPSLKVDTVIETEEVYLQVDSIADIKEQNDSHNSPDLAQMLPRGAKVSGVVNTTDSGNPEDDYYRFYAREGEVWVLETNAAQSGSPLDTRIDIVDTAGNPLVRAKLQAVRDSYFTFRGKDSTQSNDFRLFAWEEMELNDLLYSSGEVTRLWMYPRGPDSGFNVYPGTGKRHTYFDTNPVTHALQEPAYVVRELELDESPIANGLPVFTITYSNDDDGFQQLGTDSRLRFVAPRTDYFTVRLTDSRGLSGDQFRYDLIIRPATPDYKPAIDKINKPIPAGGGREFKVRIERIDGYEGPVTFELSDLPSGLHATNQVTVEAGQLEAYGVVWADEDIAVDQELGEPTVVARGEILGRTVEHQVGGLGKLKSAGKPQLSLRITADGDEMKANGNETATLTIRPGQTISAMIHVERNGLEGEIKLGNEFSGRNMPHGVFVDNIGLNGLMILKGANQHQFFITAAPIAASGIRQFHLKAEIDGGITSLPVTLQVLD